MVGMLVAIVVFRERCVHHLQLCMVAAWGCGCAVCACVMVESLKPCGVLLPSCLLVVATVGL